MSNPSLSGPETPDCRSVSVLRWIILSVVGYHLVVYAGGLVALAGGAASMNNKFSDVAVDRFRWYLIWNNLDVLLKAYLPLTVFFTLLLYPVVRFSLRRRARVTRWQVIWRSVALLLVLTAYFSFRALQSRPWLMGDLEDHQWYVWLTNLVPDGFRRLLFGFLAGVLPLFAAAAYGVYYLRRILERCAAQWPAGARSATAVLAVGCIGGILWAVPAWRYRISETAPREDNRPNILILASDSLRADHLSCNGYHRPTSPAIDELAASGVNFRKCFTPIASTVESLTTIMSSQYPHTHGLQHMFPNRQQVEKVNRESPALARLLRDQGYETAVMGDWCAGVFDVLPMGFEDIKTTTFDNFKVYMSQAVYMAHPVMALYYDNPVGYWLFPKLETSAFFVTPDVVTDRVVDRLAMQSRRRKPFFWTVFYSCTHIPYTAGHPYASKFADPNYRGPHRHQFRFNVDEWIGTVDMANKWRAMPKEDVDQITALYDGCVNRFDDCVRRVVAQLKATGQFDNTILVITSDHGDDLFEPNCTFGHGLTFNGGDQNTHIPLILHLPGRTFPGGLQIDRVVRSLDIAPTLLELAGLGKDPRMEGVSLVPYVEQPDHDAGLVYFGETSYLFCKRYIPGETPLYIETPMDGTTRIDEDFHCQFVLRDECQEIVLKTKERCIRTGRWKLVFTPGQYYDIYRLYDLEEDPHCERDVKFAFPEVYSAMKSGLERWMTERKESRLHEIFPGGEPRGRASA